MSIGLNAVEGPQRLATRSNEDEGEWRFAGEQLGLDLREGLNGLGLGDLRRIRTDKAVPSTFGSSYGKERLEIEPEHSEPWYEATGSYQPEVAFGM